MTAATSRRSVTAGVLLVLAGVLAACSDAPPVVVEPGAAAVAGAVAPATTAAAAGAAQTTAQVRYVANTGGAGVRYRVECQDSALYPGGFAEGTAVTLEQVGAGGCAGWSVVTAGVARSWIWNDYLAEQPPAVRASGAAGGTANASGVASGGGTASGGAPAGGSGQIPAFAATFQSPAGATITVAELNGEAIIQGGVAGVTYMGILSSSRVAPDSICNPNGPYGSTTGPHSIRNPQGEFGRSPSEYSAYDPSAPAPPKIRMKNATVGYLSKGNPLGRGNVDPDFLFRALGC